MAASPGSKRVGGVYFEIEGDSSDFKRELRQSETQAKRTGNVISAEFRKTEVAAAAAQKRIGAVSTSLIAMAAAAGLGIGQSVSILKDFGQAMSTVQAVTGATEAQMVALTAQARLLGATTRFSATQAAEGMIFLARAGFTADQALGAIEGTLKLAQAGALDLGRAADIASNVLSGFNLPVSETGRVVDVLAKAANSANTDVNQLGEAMKFAAPTAVALGLGLEETTAVIGKLSDAGIQGGLAGRGFQSLATQFENQRDKIEALIGPYDLAVDGISNVIKRLNEAGITTKQVIEIFRAENLDVFTILKNAAYDSAKGIDALNNKLLNARGTADQVAKTMDDNLNGAILAAISALQELVLALGDAGATPALTASFNGLANLLRTVAKNADIVGAAIIAMTIRAMIPLVVTTVPRVVSALAALSASLVGVQTQAARASTATALLGGPLTLIIAAAAAAYLYLARSTMDFDKALGQANETLTKYQKANQDVLADTGELKRANEVLAAAIRDGGQAAVDAATLEVDAIRRRIDKNNELKETYRSLLEAQTAIAGNELRGATNDYLNATGVKRGTRQIADNQRPGKFFSVPEAESDFRQRQLVAAQDLRRTISEARDAGRTLSDQETSFLQAAIKYEEQQLAYQGLVDALANLDKPVLPPPTPEGAPAVDANGNAGTSAADDLAKRLQALSALERAHALDLARANENAELVRILEMQEEIIARTADYVDLGLMTAEQARAKAAAEVTAEYEAQADAAKRTADFEALIAELNTQADANAQAAADQAAAEEAVRQSLEQSISQALNDAVRTGDWGSAVRDVFADAVSQGLSNAIADFATELVNLIGGALKGSGGGGISSFFSSLFSFGGAKAAGGRVSAGDRYLIGERGPEMFVPNTAGIIVPNSQLNPNTDTSSVRSGGSAQMNFIVQGNITEEVFPRVQQMFTEFARQVPGMVDARVIDRKKRGAY